MRLLRQARTELAAAKARFRNTLLPALAFELTDLAARLVSVRTRIARIEDELVRVAAPLPAYRLLLTIPGIGPTLAAILLAELGDIAWYSQFSQLRKLAGLDIVRVQSGQYAGQARISKGGRSLLRWALYHAAIGLARTAAGRARLAAHVAGETGRGSPRLLQGERRTGGEAPPPRVGDLAERAAL